MSKKNDDNHALKHEDLVFILAIAGRIDAQTRILAQKIDKDKRIYYAYSIFDSLSSSYSMFKYFFDVFLGGSADDMHDLMMSPAGIIGIAAESIFLVGFSFLAYHFDKNGTQDKYKKQIANAWPYFRDVMKALKNAFKGWKSTVQLLQLMNVADVRYLTMPIGLTLGILASLNRYYYRALTEQRKKMMAHNTEVLLMLSKCSTLLPSDVPFYLKKIKRQNWKTRQKGFLLSAAGGAIDGLYLYVGVLALASFSPQLLIPLAALCAFYTIGCIITRLYEEYDYQLKLEITRTKCKLVILSKRLQYDYAQLLALEIQDYKDDYDLERIRALKNELILSIDRFDKTIAKFQRQASHSTFSPILLGIRHGLYAYGSLTSILFFVSIFLGIAGTAFPPALIAAVVFSGLVLILGFAIHAWVANRQHAKAPKNTDDDSYKELLAMKEHLAQPEGGPTLTKEGLNQSLKAGLGVKTEPKYFFHEWFEVIRSLFSGLGKGQKFAGFAGNPLPEDSIVMLILGGISALIFGAVLGLRALARGFGRPTVKPADDLSSTVYEEKTEPMSRVAPEPLVLPEQLPPPTKHKLERTKSFDAGNPTRRHAFFQPIQSGRYSAPPDISSDPVDENYIIRGLD